MSPALGRLEALLDGRRRAGVYATSLDGALPGTAVAALRARGLGVRHLDTTGVRTKEGVLATCADDLELPVWFGRNWDALVDVLRDLPASVILWSGAASLDDDVRDTVLDVFAERALDEPPMWFVLVDACDGVTPL